MLVKPINSEIVFNRSQLKMKKKKDKFPDPYQSLDFAKIPLSSNYLRFRIILGNYRYHYNNNNADI